MCSSSHMLHVMTYFRFYNHVNAKIGKTQHKDLLLSHNSWSNHCCTLLVKCHIADSNFSSGWKPVHASHKHGSICLCISLQRINADRVTVKFTRNRYEKALFSVCITHSTVSLPVWLQTDRLMSRMQISSDCDQISHMGDLGEALLCNQIHSSEAYAGITDTNQDNCTVGHLWFNMWSLNLCFSYTHRSTNCNTQ